MTPIPRKLLPFTVVESSKSPIIRAKTEVRSEASRWLFSLEVYHQQKKRTTQVRYKDECQPDRVDYENRFLAAPSFALSMPYVVNLWTYGRRFDEIAAKINSAFEDDDVGTLQELFSKRSLSLNAQVIAYDPRRTGPCTLFEAAADSGCTQHIIASQFSHYHLAIYMSEKMDANAHITLPKFWTWYFRIGSKTPSSHFSGPLLENVRVHLIFSIALKDVKATCLMSTHIFDN
ncbi:hypothetical protein HYQ46_012638 [Verticillium longisporum]|nr:hypothetical protein HYQ46_012638 [Verticillium longisporum]